MDFRMKYERSSINSEERIPAEKTEALLVVMVAGLATKRDKSLVRLKDIKKILGENSAFYTCLGRLVDNIRILQYKPDFTKPYNKPIEINEERLFDLFLERITVRIKPSEKIIAHPIIQKAYPSCIQKLEELKQNNSSTFKEIITKALIEGFILQSEIITGILISGASEEKQRIIKQILLEPNFLLDGFFDGLVDNFFEPGHNLWYQYFDDNTKKQFKLLRDLSMDMRGLGIMLHPYFEFFRKTVDDVAYSFFEKNNITLSLEIGVYGNANPFVYAKMNRVGKKWRIKYLESELERWVEKPIWSIEMPTFSLGNSKLYLRLGKDRCLFVSKPNTIEWEIKSDFE